METTPAFREALNQGISSGIFIDTKIILYSRRDSHRRVCRPKALYANSHVLKTVPGFEYRECHITLETLKAIHDIVPKVLSGDSVESQSEDLQDPLDEAESADIYGYLSDSDLEDDEEVNPPPKSHEPLSGASYEDNKDKNATSSEFYQESVERYKIIKISDVAFVT